MSEDLGMKARHAIITPTCRNGRGDHEAWVEAVRRLHECYLQSLAGWRKSGKEPTFNLVLYVERPPAVGPSAGGGSAPTKGEP